MRYETERFSFDQYLARLQKRVGSTDTRRARSLPSAINSALYGWPEGRERMKNAIAQLDPPGKDTEDMLYDVAGCEPDVGRYLSGDPENMMSFQELPTKKTVRIVADVALSGACGDEVVFMRGAALVTLIENLELRGHKVELTVCSTFLITDGRYNQTTYIAYVLAKPAGQPADMDRLAYLLGNYETERVLMFETYESFYGSFPGCAPGYVPEEDRGDLYLEGGHTGMSAWQSPEAAREWINANLCRFTAPEEVAA